jgi:hypothetical protein
MSQFHHFLLPQLKVWARLKTWHWAMKQPGVNFKSTMSVAAHGKQKQKRQPLKNN